MALTDTKLKSLKPADKFYKVVDRDGMYVVVSLKGTLTFRYDYRLGTRRETITLGQYDEFQASQPKRTAEAIKYGDQLSLADARDLLARAKSEAKRAFQESGSFQFFAGIWLRDAGLADSTAAHGRDGRCATGAKGRHRLCRAAIWRVADHQPGAIGLAGQR